MRDVHKLFFLKTLNKFFHCLKQLFRNISSRNIKSIDVHFKQQYIVLFYWVTTHSKCLSQFRDCYLKGHQRWHYLKKKQIVNSPCPNYPSHCGAAYSLNELAPISKLVPNMAAEYEGRQQSCSCHIARVHSIFYLSYIL